MTGLKAVRHVRSELASEMVSQRLGMTKQDVGHDTKQEQWQTESKGDRWKHSRQAQSSVQDQVRKVSGRANGTREMRSNAKECVG